MQALATFLAWGVLTPWRRLKNAVRAILGTEDREINRIRAEWVEIQLEIANVMDKLNQWAGRQAKREAREAAAAIAPPSPESAAATDIQPVVDRKSELRRQMFGQLTRREMPHVNGD